MMHVCYSRIKRTQTWRADISKERNSTLTQTHPSMASPEEFVSPAEIVNIVPLLKYQEKRLLRSHFRRYATFSLLFFSPIASLPIFSLHFLATRPDVLSSSLPVTVAVLLLLAAFAILSAIFGVLIITYFVYLDSGLCCVNCPTTVPSSVKFLLSTSFAPFLLTTAAGFSQIAAITLPFSAMLAFSTVQFLGFLQISCSIAVVSTPSTAACFYLTSCFLVPKWGLAASVSLVEKKQSFQSIKKSADILKFNSRLPEAMEFFLDGVVLKSLMLPCLIMVIYNNHGPGFIDSVGVAVLIAMTATLSAATFIISYTVDNAFLFLSCEDPEKSIDAYDENGNILPLTTAGRKYSYWPNERPQT